jgi:VanZ family protein
MTPNRYALAAIWFGVVLFLGTAYFAATNTAPFILPLLKKLGPGASGAQLHATHIVLRKLTHVAEYALLALLWFWAIAARTARPARATWIAFLVCLACALADEAHQAIIPARTGSLRDVVIDVSGAAAALLIARGRPMSRARDQMRGGVAVEPVD